MTLNKCEMCGREDRPSMEEWACELSVKIGHYRRLFMVCDRCAERIIEHVETVVFKPKSAKP